MLFADYVELLDYTGRALLATKPGAIRGAPPRALTQARIDTDRWLDTMRSLGLLTREQYLEITAYVMAHSTPEQIAAMPAHLWQAVLHADSLLYPAGDAMPVH